MQFGCAICEFCEFVLPLAWTCRGVVVLVSTEWEVSVFVPEIGDELCDGFNVIGVALGSAFDPDSARVLPGAVPCCIAGTHELRDFPCGYDVVCT